MFYSRKDRILFIAAPKTGSRSVETMLKKMIPDGTRNEMTLESGEVVTARGMRSPSMGHATAADIRGAVGEDYFDQLEVFGMVRDPIDKLVSSYFFTRTRQLGRAFGKKTSKRWRGLVVAREVSSILMARTLPLWLWSLIHRMRDCDSYFTDAQGRVIVDYLGATERLGADVADILRRLGHPVQQESVPHTNTSDHVAPENYPVFRLVIPLLRKRYARDMRLRELVRDGVWANPERTAKVRA